MTRHEQNKQNQNNLVSVCKSSETASVQKYEPQTQNTLELFAFLS